MRRYLPFALVVLACASILYGPLLSNFFDPQEFLSFLNPLKAGESPGRYMVNSWSWMQDGRRIGFFRPLTSLTFLMEFPLWGGNPAGYRLMNVFFHLCAAILTIPLARRMGIIRLWWFVPLIVFIHPGAMDAVWFIAARNDVLAVLFSIIALILTFDLIHGKLRGAMGILPWMAALLAIGSKELGMANIAALPLVVLMWPRSAPERRALRFFWLSAPVVLLLFLTSRIMLFGNIGGYGAYTPLSMMPRRIYTMVLQSSGVFYMEHSMYRLLMAAVLSLPLISIAMTLRKTAGRPAVLASLFLLYGFQSMVGEPCLHYTYALVVFFALTTGYALENGALFGKGSSRPRRIICGAVLLLLFPASLQRSGMLKSISDPRQAVFEEVRVRADTLAALDSVTVVRGNLDNPRENETRNIELYMDYLRPENDVVFSFAQDPSRLRPGETFVVWSGDSLLLGTAPMQVPER